MNRKLVFRKYAEQRSACAPSGFKKDAIAGITRLTPTAPNLGGVVMFSQLDEDQIDRAISQQIDYFDRLGRDFEWKVHDFDAPANLTCRLHAFGFAEDAAAEALMIYDVGAHRGRTIEVDDVQLERISSDEGIRHVVANQEKIWSKPMPWLEAYLKEALGRLAVYCAYDVSTDLKIPIGAGWIEFVEGSEFAEMHGGSVLQPHRGRGIYSLLFEERVEEAIERRVNYLAVDAAPMSRPILLAKGFKFICETTPYRRSASAD